MEDYKQQIIEMLDKIDRKDALRYLWIITSDIVQDIEKR